MQKRVYEKGEINKLFVVNKPMFISSNFYLNRFKRAYKNKKAGFSGTLDPFAKGCLIVAFGQYAKLFKYLEKTPKVYKAVIWLGVTSESLDIERIQDIVIKEKLETDFIKKEIEKLKGEIEYIPPKFSAKRVNGQKAYEIAREGLEFELKSSIMKVFDIKFIRYNHPFISFEVKVSEGSYIRSLAQIFLKNIACIGTLSYLERVSEGKFYFENYKELNPLDFIDLPKNNYTGTKEWLEVGKKISKDYLSIKENGKYIIELDTFFSIIEIIDGEVKYLLNKVSKIEAKMTKKSYAKVNIFLKIVGIRENYHLIASRFVRVKNLFDTISFIKKDVDNFSIEGNFSCVLEKNTVYKAYKELEKFDEVKEFFKKNIVKIDKNIPEFAGLGGGSSNCATFLNMVNIACNLNLNKEELAKIGSNIGADVPFFVYEFDSANVSGIGEIVEEFKEELINIEVITPKIACDTGKIYKNFREKFYKEQNMQKVQDDVKELFATNSKDILEKFSINEANDLYFPALDLNSDLKKFEKDNWFFSGSGSSFFKIL